MSLVATLNSGVSALTAFSEGIQVISNNIANVNTTAYKGSRAEYSDSFSNILRQAAPAPSSGNGSNTAAIQIGTGVRVSGVTGDFTQGTLTSTGKNTDLSIAGSGFFRVRDTLNSVDYATRSGAFRLDDTGFLVTSDGFRVQGLTGGGATFSATDNGGSSPKYTKTAIPPGAVGDIKIAFEVSVGSGMTNDTAGAFTDTQVNNTKPTMQSFSVNKAGDVIIGMSNGDTVKLGQVLLQNFSDPNALTKVGNNLFSGFGAAGPIGGSDLTAANNGAGTNGLGSIQGGALELSNVDLSKQMTDMIIIERSFQAASRVVTVSDRMLEEIVNLKR